MLDPDLKVISNDTVGSIRKDPTGENFPWIPPLVPTVDESPFINDTPTLVALTEGCDVATIEAVEKSLNTVAKLARDSLKEGESDKFRFSISRKENELAPRVRSLIKIGEPKNKPELVLLDLQ